MSREHSKVAKQIGERLVELRKKKKLTQEQIRIKSGLTNKQIVNLEKGRSNFQLATVLAYLKVVGGALKVE